jgi:signal transduction histidine kinase
VIRLSQTEDELDLTIEDDGKGVDRPMPGFHAASTRGLGVIGVRERTQALGGTFVLEPRLGGGTRVAVRLPLAPRTAADESPSQLLAG